METDHEKETIQQLFTLIGMLRVSLDTTRMLRDAILVAVAEGNKTQALTAQSAIEDELKLQSHSAHAMLELGKTLQGPRANILLRSIHDELNGAHRESRELMESIMIAGLHELTSVLRHFDSTLPAPPLSKATN
jgi:hypothetical protein